MATVSPVEVGDNMYKDVTCTSDSDVVGGRSDGPLQIATTFVGLCVTGMWFGALFERSHVFEPTSIRQQFIFKKWIMIKMFMGAVAGGAFSFCVIYYFSPARFQMMRRKNLSISYPCVIFGSFLLGTGMCAAGACPGMVLPQVGSLVDNSLVTLSGGFIGALAFNILCGMGASERLQRVHYSNKEEQMKAEYADLYFDYPALPLMMGFAVFAGVVALLLEVLVPFRDELLDYNGGKWRDSAFPPSLCGLGIGCINIMTALLVDDSIGSATGYAQVMGKELLSENGCCGASFVQVYWQVPYLTSSVLGAFLSANLADNFPNETPGISEAWVAFLGGFLMLFGSRLGGGCTSGHGIAAMPMLNMKSIVGCCAMFGGAVALGVVLETQGALSLQ